VILVEHGVYVREAYLSASSSGVSAGRQLSSTRLATALARLAYHVADKITPVTSAHRPWERYLGAPDARIEPIVNGIDSSRRPTAPRNGRTVVSVGRIDPLKDIVTMLHTARHTIDRMPDVQFRHYGPASPHNREYDRMCRAVHAALGLGDRFVFMGPTTDAHGVIRAADLYLSTSISEGLPLSLLEAMTEARPIVSTDVGGCAEVVAGCGMVVNAGDSLALSHAITTILAEPDLARMLGQRGHRRARRRFSIQRQHQRYRELIAAACDGTLAADAAAHGAGRPVTAIGSVA
jgi:glycosyltransferase involved in cell wall biosynthesis